MRFPVFTSLFGLALLLAACQGDPVQEQAAIPTNTLAPFVSMTPRFTATPIPTRTPLPTFTFTPSNTPMSPTPSNTPTPTATPPITGIIASLETVNVREGPGTNFDIIETLVPGTGVQVIALSSDGRWFNIRMEDGREGWLNAGLLRVDPTPTLFPTATPSPNLTALALGGPLPTAVLGGGTITPTPPRSVTTATPVSLPTTAAGGPTLPPPLPVIDVTTIAQTATALALPTATPTATATPLVSPTPTIPAVGATLTPGPGTLVGTAAPLVDIGALCDDPAFGIPRPRNVRSTDELDVFWAWFAATPQLVDEHIATVTYEVAVNGVVLESLRNWRLYGLATRQVGTQSAKFWYVPIGRLPAGEHRITYRATWSRAISDGLRSYGPGTENPEEVGSCTFVVTAG